MRNFNIIVVGGGLAGMRALIEGNRRNLKVALFSKVHPVRSHSIAAQGGINAALGNHPRGFNDSVEKHAYDTIKGSDYLADQDAVIKMCTEAPGRIYEMEHWGCPFSRAEDGKIAQRPFGGAGFPRTCYAADRTGHMLLHTLYGQVVKFEHWAERGETVVMDEWLVTAIAMDEGTCVGIVALDLASGRLEAFHSDAVVFATGGACRIYGNSTNAVINTGMGMAVPYWAGVPLKDMEFIQFHPTTLYGTNILVTEGARGEGGFLLNNKGERFLANYPDSKKAMEVAPRDIVSRNIIREIEKGGGFPGGYILLDLRHIGARKIMERLPGIRELCMNFAGVDPVEKPVPVQPGAHYTMGGIDTNPLGECKIKGLYSAGESACVSVHGANRLGGNSLLETIVYGKIAGESAGEYVVGKGSAGPSYEKVLNNTLKREGEKLDRLLKSNGKERMVILKEEMNKTMAEKVGIFRDAEGLKDALARITDLRDRYKKIGLTSHGRSMNQEMMWTIELGGSLDVADAILRGALARKESRGSHFRKDFPKRDDGKWLKHSLAYYSEKGAVLEYAPVTISKFQPKEREY